MPAQWLYANFLRGKLWKQAKLERSPAEGQEPLPKKKKALANIQSKEVTAWLPWTSPLLFIIWAPMEAI